MPLVFMPPERLSGRQVTVFGLSWTWIPQDVERGHWEAEDGTGVTIFPASDGIADLMVCIPDGPGGKESVLHLAATDLETAFRFATKARAARAN